jgi:hypothetical protein
MPQTITHYFFSLSANYTTPLTNLPDKVLLSSLPSPVIKIFEFLAFYSILVNFKI